MCPIGKTLEPKGSHDRDQRQPTRLDATVAAGSDIPAPLGFVVISALLTVVVC